MIQLHASATPRLTQCPGHAFLPQVQSASAVAALGTAAHGLAAVVVQGGFPTRLGVATVAASHGCDKDELQILVYAIRDMWEEYGQHFPNPETEVQLPEQAFYATKAGAEAEQGDLVILEGRADIVSCPGDRTLRIADWKSGWQEETDYMPQLKTYAMLARMGRLMDENIDRVYAAIFWLRTRTIEPVWFSKDELIQWHGQLTELLKEGASGTLVLGGHCNYCPVASCPALNSRALAILPDQPLEITRDNIEAAHHFAKAAETRIESLKTAIRQYVYAHGAVDIGGGKELALSDRVTRKIRPRTAEAWQFLSGIAKEKLYDLIAVQKDGIEEAVKEGIRNANGGKPPKGAIGEGIKAFEQELENMHAIEASATKVLAVKKKGEPDGG